MFFFLFTIYPIFFKCLRFNFKGENPSKVEIGRCNYLFCSIIWVRKWNLFFNFKLYLYIKQNFSIFSFFFRSETAGIFKFDLFFNYLFINTSNVKISKVIELEYGNESVDLGSWKKKKMKGNERKNENHRNVFELWC